MNRADYLRQQLQTQKSASVFDFSRALHPLRHKRHLFRSAKLTLVRFKLMVSEKNQSKILFYDLACIKRLPLTKLIKTSINTNKIYFPAKFASPVDFSFYLGSIIPPLTRVLMLPLQFIRCIPRYQNRVNPIFDHRKYALIVIV